MELTDVLRRRRMIRDYRPDPVPAEVIDRLTEAGRRSPTAGFTQGVSFLVLDRPDDVAGFWSATGDDDDSAVGSSWLAGMRSAPVLILVWTSEAAYLDRYAEPDKGWTDRDPARWSAPYWWVDAGMAAQTILLAAVDAGLGGCFFGIPPEQQDEVRRRFGVPTDQLSAGVITLGYPASAGTPGSPTRRPRRPANDQIRHHHW
ncbi:nitroreductase family protein [Microlunatus speluncae]|uniref:nitroreductase family protein n=1 Tax=Microlunatus speluncae TaxID=2594267 RepID=UPI0012665601|nr:nitroreductase family protein [Microlunatus speluncae]